MAILLLPAGVLYGQSDPASAEALLIPLLSGPVELDGRVVEPAWEALPPLPPTMHVPNFGEEPTEVTEFRIAHDGEALYYSCRAFDSDPSGIRTPSLERDESSFSNDWCMIGLDTFFDRETLLLFATTPAGVRTDVAFINDTESGPIFSWNTFWDASVSRDEEGWSAEIRIPFSSLRFQVVEGQVTMGVTLTRLVARKNEIATYPPISPQWGTFSFFKASQSRRAVLEGVAREDPLYLTSYLIGGAGYTHALDDEETAYDKDRDALTEAGLDLKYGLSENLTLDLTANTDFAQVEVDDQQVNLTRFSLFFPEKRPFFQERNNVFDYTLGGNERLFHSRRIGLSGGEPIRVYGGARLVGRVGEWDVGALVMETEAPDEDGSPENAAVIRLRRRVLNEATYVGGILTSRLGNSGTRNVLYGWDAILRLFGQDYLTLNWAQSFDGEEDPGARFLDRSLARLHWQRRGEDGLVYEVDLSRAGSAFEPGLGFLYRRDYAKLAATTGYGWRPGAASSLLRYAFSTTARAFRRGEDGRIETAEVEPQLVVELKSRDQFTVKLTTTYDDLTESFEPADDAEVPEGDYTFTSGQLVYRPSMGRLLRTDVTLQFGEYYDGRRISASLKGTWNLSRHLELQGTYAVEDVIFQERDQSFRAHIARLRAEPRLSTRLTGAVFAQYSSASRRFLVNVRVRWNPREGNDLYLVWNEGLVTDRHSFDPIRPHRDRRTLILKYSHTVTLGF